jgi:hypothetical protein
MEATMQLITKAIEAKLAKKPLYSTDGEKISDVIVKFFTPDSSWTWWAIEGEKQESDWVFFGLVEGHERELGYFRLSELLQIRGGFGLPIERDRHFSGYKIDKTNNTLMR